MAMSKKDYVAVAAAIREQNPGPSRDETKEAEHATCCQIAYALADYFAADNPRFARSRFLEACGVTS